ncbi:MAG: helix-turn-helix domain-containing protein [Clostridia bacterium]|nr:helix-turn-helix domain-containing protein [Clostridia bacterium]
MFYNAELNFLQEVFKRNRVHTSIITKKELREFIKNINDKDLEHLFSAILPKRAPINNLQGKTVYKLTDSIHRNYLYLLLPDCKDETLLVVGPYLSEPMTEERSLLLCESAGFAPIQHQALSEYFNSLGILADGSQLMIAFHTFCELLWKSPSFSIVEFTQEQAKNNSSTLNNSQNYSPQDTLINMKAMEQRYAFENEIIQAVTNGKLHFEKQLSSAFSGNLFEMRVADPLRNAKNYTIIMNTLLRKAAEKGGVHPIHINRISSEFATKIELLTSTNDIPPLMREMFTTYCRLVRNNNVRKYSTLIQKTITLIDSGFSAGLTPKSLAVSQGVSAGYLAIAFKKETGKTLSEYIRSKRIEFASQLLLDTNLQVQTIAFHCGIMDVQYFSKLFKKETNLTPSEYRNSHRTAGQV